ncbi:Bicarbonate transporter, C-terminal [Cynara cardunculus var. scolymus]|uniref:Bicarbonate transporter, C-terminal n=1 Tax=Cynara cardunculus var. scolymus TaxID=59895 RepID=A0A103YBE2_CYNCS|nr:Bicarbonate transporter, C-terminal [Cynara cardunculus var. scolymus]
MEHMRSPFRGIVEDVRGRALILAPTTYIFFASALPVIAFGEQLSRDTDGSLSTVETLISTAICGLIHSILGGQPLLILGVAEPTIIMYTYLYNFAKGKQALGQHLFLAWAGWRNFWDVNCRSFHSRGRKVSEFKVPKNDDPNKAKYQFQWLYANGLLAIAFSFGLLYTALKSRKARSCWLSKKNSTSRILQRKLTHRKLRSKTPSICSNNLKVVYQFIRKKLVASAKESIKQKASNSEIYNKMQTDAVMKVEEDTKLGKFDPEEHIDAHLPVRVNEQRVSNLLQSLLLAASITAMPLIKLIPTSLLWGYFAYMAIDSLPGNQFWERILLLFVHASFVESVPFRSIAIFTIFQIMYFLVCYGVTWIPIAGILFPVPFFLLISIRQHILPKLFQLHHLRELDAAEYEEIAGEVTMCDAEILDELTTSRGELKRR